ncbi:TIGR04283 family arsenosugar biosynthesis glycosyltransferase [Pontibaca salina]|uniref:TIGR04283 family arsenosugar biosynthesis glycosyltransferase n=1 Tax=Pontibaca salina TaxID=2795731 RepID=A0A934LYA0_9RHOB|nr:TIGR04283 family arsenosugar biosynthesis glycosyltransferase [Pontibaca salina]MBI6629532.1 TIGR04283 family arsenosugar biosynthesis glycosyltransferase [Pontibaca salina]
MQAPISVIIPTLNVSGDLTGCIKALAEGQAAGLIREIIVTDGGSTDRTCVIARDLGAHIVTGPPSRGGQLRRGVAAAQGPWLLVLHADSILAPGWSGPVAEHIAQGQGAGWFRLTFRARGLAPSVVGAWANLRARMFALPYGDQGLLLSLADYDLAGGYPDQRLMEDVALVRALSCPLVRLNATITTSAVRYLSDGWLRRGAGNIWTLIRYLSGVCPESLADRYQRK